MSESYRQAYATLERIARQLEGGETDLDEMLPLLEEATKAYEICRSRLEAVQHLLEARHELGE